MVMRAILVGLLVIGAVVMLETDASAQRGCGNWGCCWCSAIKMCAEVKGVPQKPSIVVVTFTDVVIEAICIGPQGQVVTGQASRPRITRNVPSTDFEVDETGRIIACVEVESDIPQSQICNNNWEKARAPEEPTDPDIEPFTPSDAIISYKWIGEWFACQPESRDDPDPCQDAAGALTIASSPFDRDTGFCSGDPDRDADNGYVPTPLGRCTCTEINPD